MTHASRIATWLAAAVLAATPLAASLAAPAPHQGSNAAEASIPFVNHGSIRNWHAIGDRTLYVQDTHNNWYRAELMGPCLDLNFVEAIGFETRGTDRLDRFSSIVVRGRPCAFRSFVASEGPPKKAKKPRRP